jgi:hypothetical protein
VRERYTVYTCSGVRMTSRRILEEVLNKTSPSYRESPPESDVDSSNVQITKSRNLDIGIASGSRSCTLTVVTVCKGLDNYLPNWLNFKKPTDGIETVRV